MGREPDDFETRARSVVGDRNSELLSKLLALRDETKQLSAGRWSKGQAPTAKDLNDINQKMFNRAAAMLGAEKFEELFGFPAHQKINLVDARLLARRSPVRGRSVRHAAVKVVPSTVTLKHLAASLAAANELSRPQAEAIVGGLVGKIVKHLKKGQRIRISGLGVLQVRKRAARMGRNPATGEAIQIKASKKVSFRAAKDLKEAI